MKPSFTMKFVGPSSVPTILKETSFSVDGQKVSDTFNTSYFDPSRITNWSPFIWKKGVNGLTELFLNTAEANSFWVLNEENSLYARALASALNDADKSARAQKRQAAAEAIAAACENNTDQVELFARVKVRSWLENMFLAPDDSPSRLRAFFNFRYCKKGVGMCWVQLSARWFDAEKRLRPNAIIILPYSKTPNFAAFIAGLKNERALALAQKPEPVKKTSAEICTIPEAIAGEGRELSFEAGELHTAPTPQVISVIIQAPLILPNHVTSLEEATKRLEWHQKARLLTITGEVPTAVKIFELLRNFSSTLKDRLYLTGQIINAQFIGMGTEHATARASWMSSDLKAEVLHALKIKDVKRSLLEPAIDPDILNLIGNVLGFPGWYALLWAVITETEITSDVDAQERLLEKHIRIIRKIQTLKPDVGWNRYTPLIAQALRLNQVDFAAMAWNEARKHAFRDPQRDPMARHAVGHRRTGSVEWSLHELLGVSLSIRKRDYQKAFEKSRELSFKQAVDAPEYILWAVNAFREKSKRLHSNKRFDPSSMHRIKFDHHEKYIVV